MFLVLIFKFNVLNFKICLIRAILTSKPEEFASK